MSLSESLGQRIHLIEDDTMLAELIAGYLQQQGYDVSLYNDAEMFLEQVDIGQVQIIVCDINLPEMSGFELCQSIRRYYHGPFLFLTARSDDFDQIKGLNLGANDYINKPVKPNVLLARIEAAIRSHRIQSPSLDTQNRIVKPGLIIDKASRLLTVNSNPVALTSDEFELLWHFISVHGQTLSRDQLFKLVVGREYNGQDRTIDARISRLRKKFNSIEDNPYEIKTVWRKGYCFTDKAL